MSPISHSPFLDYFTTITERGEVERGGKGSDKGNAEPDGKKLILSQGFICGRLPWRSISCNQLDPRDLLMADLRPMALSI